MRRLVAGTGWKMNLDAAATARYAAALAPAVAGFGEAIDMFAKAIVDTWLASAFDPEGPSAGNVEAINSLTEKYAKPV
jgi:ribose 5-phosphate isomerase RpiB